VLFPLAGIALPLIEDGWTPPFRPENQRQQKTLPRSRGLAGLSRAVRPHSRLTPASLSPQPAMPPLDGATFDASYRRIYPLVLAKCRRMLRGHADAADVSQEVFLRLWKQRELIQDSQALTAWLYRTSTRLVIDRARRSTLSRESLLYLQTVALGEDEHRGEERLVSRQDLRTVVSEFPAKELEAAILNRLDRLTHPEIAEVMGVGERTVRRLLGRFDERVSKLKGSA